MNRLADVLDRALRMVGRIMLAWLVVVIALVMAWWIGSFMARHS